jgi:hypothetical protein
MPDWSSEDILPDAWEKTPQAMKEEMRHYTVQGESFLSQTVIIA